MTAQKPHILCVDDEERVLDGLSDTLHRHYRVSKATSGPMGLAFLAQHPDIKVVMSDMQMPVMNGAVFLTQAKTMAPHATRLLLTGHADLQSALAAVNEGQIFRFLTKPCAPEALRSVIQAAVQQHDLIMAEKTLLEETLRGSIKALTDVLAFSHPEAFGRAARVSKIVRELGKRLKLENSWEIEIAAMMSQLGSIILPPATMERFYHGEALAQDELLMVDRMSSVAEQILANIPRLEGVRDLLKSVKNGTGPSIASHALRIALDFDALERQGVSTVAALDALKASNIAYNPDILRALSDNLGHAGSKIQEIPLSALSAGMIIAQDLKTQSGALFVARGYEVTQTFVERVKNMIGSLPDPVKVIFPDN